MDSSYSFFYCSKRQDVLRIIYNHNNPVHVRSYGKIGGFEWCVMKLRLKGNWFSWDSKYF